MAAETKHISMRLESELKQALEETLEAEEGKPSDRGGRAGGLTLLFRRLACLYLRRPLPPQRYREDEQAPSLYRYLPKAIRAQKPSIEDLSLDEAEGFIQKLERAAPKLGKTSKPRLFDDGELTSLDSLELGLTFLCKHHLLSGKVCWDQHQALNLLGRIHTLKSLHSALSLGYLEARESVSRAPF